MILSYYYYYANINNAYTTAHIVSVKVFFCNTFIPQGHIKLLKDDSINVYTVTKYFYFK